MNISTTLMLLSLWAPAGVRAGEPLREGAAGAGKGVIAASEEGGVRLAPGPLATFGIKVLALTGAGPWRVPPSARLFSLEEVNLFRLRDGYFKRIDFTEVGREKDVLLVRSAALRPGDALAIEGVGYLRLIELNALGGEPTGHSH